MKPKIVFDEYKGDVRVGKIIYKNGKPVYPKYKDYTPIVVMTKSSKYGDLGPYVLKDDNGVIMENKWQFSKFYPWVPEIEQKYSNWDNTIIWSHPQEIHQDKKGNPNQKYWKWREKGMKAKYPVRYPVGNTKHKALCKYVLSDENEKLDIKDSREKVYLKTYANLVSKESKFKDLKKRLKNGENMLIIEIDGPHQESLSYYMEKYGVDEDFIIDNTIEVSMENMGIMMKDEKHSFGHGYCLAMTLLGWCDKYIRR